MRESLSICFLLLKADKGIRVTKSKLRTALRRSVFLLGKIITYRQPQDSPSLWVRIFIDAEEAIANSACMLQLMLEREIPLRSMAQLAKILIKVSRLRDDCR